MKEHLAISRTGVRVVASRFVRLAAAVAISASAAACAHHTLKVEPYKPGTAEVPVKGIVYALPKTVFQLKTVVGHTKEGAFTGIHEITLASLQVPDREAEFQIPLEGAGNEALLDVILNFKFASTGFLVGADVSYADKTADVIKEVASLVLSVGKLGFRAKGVSRVPEEDEETTTLVFFADPADEGTFKKRDADLVWSLKADESAPVVEMVLSGAAAWRRPAASAAANAADGLYGRFPRHFFGKIVIRKDGFSTESPVPPVAIAQFGTPVRFPVHSKTMSSRRTNVEFHDTTGAPKEYSVTTGGSKESAEALAKSIESLAQAMKSP